jgi:hypothetical protein
MTVARTEITTARRIVVKVGSSSLTTRSGGIDVDCDSLMVVNLALEPRSAFQLRNSMLEVRWDCKS